MTATPTTDAVLATLTAQRAAIPDDGQLPLSTTKDEAAAIKQQGYTLDCRIADVRNKDLALAAVPSTDADEKWLAFLSTARATIDAELLAMPPRIRNAEELAQQQSLTFSISLIDNGLDSARLPIVNLISARIGALMREAGYLTTGADLRGPNGWRGCIKEVERRIAQHKKQRVEARAALDEALIDDNTRAAREADDKVFREVMNTMHLKNDSTGTGLVAFTLDGDELPVDAMTRAQRAAFDRFEAAHFGRPRETVSV